MKMVFICHPYRDDPKGNREKVTQIVRDIVAYSPGILPLAPQLYLHQLGLDDEVFIEREIIIDMSSYLVKSCDELWVFGDTITDGMEQEILFAHKHKIPVITK